MPDRQRDLLRDQLQTTLGASYTLERELGGGGMSRVFVAEETRFRRRVVLKVLAPELAEGLSAERFEREIGLAAALQEPHIVPVLSAGDVDGLPWYSMPYVAGESLRARLGRGSVPLGEVVAILRDVARALAYAHAQGVVHRDIKPENVLLHEGTAVVADFGIAKAVQRARTVAPDGPGAPTQVGLTQLGTSLGTPAYMAPEQAAGDPATDHRADLYAWGVVAYELLAGRHPFADRTSPQALLAAHMAEAPAPLPKVVPRPLAALVTRCLAKDPAERPASAAEVLAALGSASIADASSGGRRVAPLALAGLAVVVLLALGGGALAWRARAGAAPAGDRQPIVAVLPFETAGGAPGVVPDTAFADGLGDAITGKLARLQGLRVIDRGSVRSVENAAAHPQAAGRTLGADYVLRATLRWARGADGQPRVQVSPVLVRVSDGGVRWAGEPTVVTPGDPFAAQGTLATAVAEALDVALAPTERAGLARPATTDTAAFAAVERGRRLWDRAAAGTPQEQVQALREFERAYQRDPQYADAWGWAADVLQWMAQGEGSVRPALYDSAAVLARRALALDPGQSNAVNTLSVVELFRGRPAESGQMVERAARAFPSSASLQGLLASARYQAGDSAGAVDAVARAIALAPRSQQAFLSGVRAMLALRRYDDVRDLLARAQALEPEAIGVQRAMARLAVAVGDTVGLSAMIRTLRVRAAGPSAGRGTEVLYWMRVGDVALQQELAALSLATLGATTTSDSVSYYSEKAQLFLTRGAAARARALADSGFRVSAARVTSFPVGSSDAANWSRAVAWFAAIRGDRSAAVAALRQAAADPLIPGQLGSVQDAAQTCTSAEAYGLLGDADTMLPFLRRCLTMANGYHLAQLGEPAFARVRLDPRVRALTAEFAAAQARARSTPVLAAPAAR